MKLPVNKLLWGDSSRLLKAFPSDSIDSVVTDPPYGINFLGKHWDKALPNSKIWEECLRVLKPGAFAFVFCLPRADGLYRMIRGLEEVGFNVGFTPIFWTFASGMPKAVNMGKVIDKRLGGKSEIVGYKPHTNQDMRENSYASPKNLGKELLRLPIIKPVSEEGKKFEGAYASFLPKPAVEVIIVAMKPLSEKTYIEQALKNGKGVVWFDDCKIPKTTPTIPYGGGSIGTNPNYNYGKPIENQGRFPPNLIVQDNVLDCGRITKSVGGNAKNNKRYSGGFKDNHYEGVKPGFGDTGDFSRYFSLDSWWEKRLLDLPEAVQKTFPFMVGKKASTKERDFGCAALPQKFLYPKGNLLGLNMSPIRPDGSKRSPIVRRNTHKTVKPLEVISYLITLGSRPGDIVLDPFLGSGTTAISASLLHRNWIGIEKEEEYVNIAEARLRAFTKNTQDEGSK